MKQILILLLLVALTSCGGKTVYVWHMNDLIGLFIILAIIGIAVIVGIIQWIKNKMTRWFNR